MKLSYIEVFNFASYKHERFDFHKTPYLFAIIGNNGGGKSTFFVETLTVALFNRSRTSTTQGTGVENLITTGEDKLEVQLGFEIDHKDVKIIRRRFAKGGQELELFINGIDHTEKIKDTQAKIHNLIKMDYDTFLDTVCISQGKSGSFMEKPPTERKEVLTQILSLDKYDTLHEFTKELRKETNSKIKAKKEDLAELSETVELKEKYDEEIFLGDSEVAKLTLNIDAKDKELENELAEKASYEQKVKQRNEVLGRQNRLRDKVTTTESSIIKGTQVKEQLEETVLQKETTISSLETFTAELETVNAEILSLNSEKSTLEGTNTVLIKQAKDLKAKHDRMKEFNEAQCGFCGQEVTDDHKQKHLQELFTEASGYIKQKKGNDDVISSLQTKISELMKKEMGLRQQIQLFGSKKSAIEQAEVKLSGVTNRLEELNTELEGYKIEYQNALLEEVVEVENKVFKDGTIRMELNTLRSQLTSWNNRIAIAKNELTKIEKDKEKIFEIEQELKDLQNEYAKLDDLQYAWGKDGIQAGIIENSLEEIEDEINDVLDVLSNSQESIEFITQKEKGKGKNASSIETLDIVIKDKNGARVYESYSGGERFRVDFACHVGLSKFLAKRAGAAIDFFILDEGVGSQDEVAKENFIRAVHSITTKFSKVMVITHIPDIIDAFHDKVEVYKDPIEGSKIRII